jgi:galactose mutarotase-like enzyme
VSESPAKLRAISADGSTVAEFVPDLGMVCCSLCIEGEERLDARKGLEAYGAHGSTMGMPLLYPWANRLGGTDFDVAGRQVTLPDDPTRIHLDQNGLPRHGVMPGLMRWQPVGADPDADADAVVTARLEWTSPELLELFPFAHQVRLEARAEPRALRITTTVRANAGDRVPVAFGFHPYLRLPGARAGWSVEIPAGQLLILDGRMLPTGERRPIAAATTSLEDADFDDAVELAGDAARFVASAAGPRVVVELIEGYGFGQIYSPPDSSFVCFEPMTAPADALRSGDGLRILEPGEEHRAVFGLSFGSP